MRETIFSPCRRYRYTLWREWYQQGDFLTGPAKANQSYLAVIGLNPSTADETKDDPTIRRCIDFAKRWGYGGLCMLNLFAWRDTKPADMKKAAEPVGEDNDFHICSIARGAGLVLAAWGTNGWHLDREGKVIQLAKAVPFHMHCLAYNDDGSPMHPLYTPKTSTPLPWPKPKSDSPAHS